MYLGMHPDLPNQLEQFKIEVSAGAQGK